jgi:hypothetical protein
MKSSIAFRRACTAALLGLGSILPMVAADAPAPGVPGDMWEVTSHMSIEGMPKGMPPQKVSVCSPKEWTEPPGGADERRRCTNSDFRMDGPKATWKVSCAGPPAMTGDGEIAREGDDAFAGTIRFTSSEASMTVKLQGRRIGDCEKPH